MGRGSELQLRSADSRAPGILINESIAHHVQSLAGRLERLRRVIHKNNSRAAVRKEFRTR